MKNKVEITLDEFKEYMDLKSQANLHSSQIDKMMFMSNLSFMDLCEMAVQECSIIDLMRCLIYILLNSHQ